MISQQIYSSNSTRDYPLKEGSASGIPNDLLVDMSITVPEGIDPVVTAVSVTPFSFFMALEDAITKEGIGQISIASPASFTVYKFEMVMTGAYGWIVPGSGIGTEGLYTKIEVPLDPSTILIQPSISDALDSIEVNDIENSIEGLLGIRNLFHYVKATTEERNIDGVGTKRCIVLSRNDETLTSEELYSSFTALQTDYTGAVFTIGGVEPDDAGNIDIDSFPSSFMIVPILDDTNGEIGLLLLDYEQICEKAGEEVVQHGKCEQGISTIDGLPCDPLVVARNPKYLLDDCGCEDPGDAFAGAGIVSGSNVQIASSDPGLPTVTPGDVIWVTSSTEEGTLYPGTYQVVSGDETSFEISPTDSYEGADWCPDGNETPTTVTWSYIGPLPS